MQKKKKNWWVILAIVIIGIPVGYVAMGVIKNMTNKEPTMLADNQMKIQEDTSTDNTSIKADSTTTDVEEQEQILTDNEQNDKNVDGTSNSPVSNKQEDKNKVEKKSLVIDDEAQRQREEQERLRREKQAHKAEQRAEQQRLQREEQQRLKEEKAEQQRLQREEQARIKKEKEEQARKEKERKAEEAQQKKADEERKKAELAEQKRREAEIEAEKKKNELKIEVQRIVSSGQKSSKVSDDCSIVVNGRNTTDYQAFRQGVNYRAYTNVRVADVSTDASGKITRIKVTATESKDTE